MVGDGTAEQITLSFVDRLACFDQFELAEGLNSLHRHVHPEFGDHLGEAIHQGPRARLGLEVGCEGLVDFDLVDRKFEQIGEAGKAGAEVVEHDAYAQVAQGVDRGERACPVVEEGFQVNSTSSLLGPIRTDPARL